MSIKKELKNPLLEREKYNSLIKEKTEDEIKEEIIIKKTIAAYGDIKHLTKNILETVDFNNKEFINRIYDNEIELFDSDFYELKESIKEIGIINMIYLLEKENGKILQVDICGECDSDKSMESPKNDHANKELLRFWKKWF